MSRLKIQDGHNTVTFDHTLTQACTQHNYGCSFFLRPLSDTLSLSLISDVSDLLWLQLHAFYIQSHIWKSLRHSSSLDYFPESTGVRTRNHSVTQVVFIFLFFLLFKINFIAINDIQSHKTGRNSSRITHNFFFLFLL